MTFDFKHAIKLFIPSLIIHSIFIFILEFNNSYNHLSYFFGMLSYFVYDIFERKFLR